MDLRRATSIGLRITIAAAFLSAVADRLGLWGGAGDAGVVWGNFDAFLEYTALLNPFLPPTPLYVLGVFVTVLEVALAVLLLVGLRLREVAFSSGALLMLFALSMTINIGLKAPLDYGVFTAAAAAMALGAFAPQSSKRQKLGSHLSI